MNIDIMTIDNNLLLIIMGASGVGKSTLGRSLAQALDYRFVEADDFHSDESIEKMRAGHGLTNDDREPWIQSLISDFASNTTPAVLAWSGLVRDHRNRFRTLSQTVKFVHLEANTEVLTERLEQRKNHFMPASQVKNQLSTLESTSAESDVLHVSAAATTLDQQAQIISWLQSNNKN